MSLKTKYTRKIHVGYLPNQSFFAFKVIFSCELPEFCFVLKAESEPVMLAGRENKCSLKYLVARSRFGRVCWTPLDLDKGRFEEWDELDGLWSQKNIKNKKYIINPFVPCESIKRRETRHQRKINTSCISAILEWPVRIYEDTFKMML